MDKKPKNPPIQKTESLSRFFHKGKPVPCWLAGRYRHQNQNSFQLFSQGTSLNLFRTEAQAKEMQHLQTGDWIRLLLKDTEGHFSRWELLQKSPISTPSRTETTSLRFLQFAADWEAFLNSVKSFFNGRALEFIRTPSLLKATGTEPHLQPLKTKATLRGKAKELFLPTSPELSLKKLLCLGATDFFEIKKCFRDGEEGALHSMEFFLLEWYRTFFSLEELINETEELLKHLKKLSFFKGSFNSLETFTFKELFKKHLKFSLSPETGRKELAQLAERCGLQFSPTDAFQDLFHLLFLNCIEPSLPQDHPLVIRDYPPELRAYAKINSQGWANRFELYWRGMELANAFEEVTQAEEQETLFKKELNESGRVQPLDTELLTLMKQGMPPCCGIAVGLDRLFAAICGRENISFFRYPEFLL